MKYKGTKIHKKLKAIREVGESEPSPSADLPTIIPCEDSLEHD